MAASRQALNGISNGLRAFQDGMKQLGQASVRFGVATKSIAILCKKFTTDTTRAYYNIAGHYTFPIEQELVGSQPPLPSQLNLAGRIGISLPVILPTMLLSVSVIPFLGNTVQSLPHGFVDVTNLALADLADEDQIPYPAEHRNVTRKVYGGIGYLLGASVGVPTALTVGICRIIGNTALSIPRTFVPLINLTLADEDTIPDLEADQRTNTAYIMGVSGLGLGVVFGVLGMIATIIARILQNTFISLANYLVHSINFALPYEVNSQIKLIPDVRNRNSFLLGMLGIPLGLIFGGIAALFVTSAISIGRIFVDSLNSALAYNDQIDLGIDRRGIAAKLFGFIPGLVIGGIFGEIAGLLVLLTRCVINTCKSFAYFFQQGLSLGLPTPLAIADERRESGSLWLGALGAIAGAISGFITGCIASTAISTAGSFITVTNFALHKDNQIKLEPDTRTGLGKIMGSIGYLIGVPTGLISALTVFLSRIMINCATSWLYAFKYTLNLGLPETGRLANPETRDVNTQCLGGPGLLIGGCFGIITAFFASTAITTAGVWMTLTNLALEDKFILSDDTRGKFGKRLGALGFIIGGITGCISALLLQSRHLFGNGRFSFIKFFRSAINLSLPAHQQLVLTPDTRSTLKQVLGFFTGGITGCLLGGVTAFFISTALSTVNAFKVVTNFALEDELDAADTRGTIGKMLGGLGWVLGGTAGLLGAFSVVCARLLRNSATSFMHFFKLSLNIGLPSDYHLTTEDNRRLTNKIFGVPGLLLGAVFGSIAAFFASSGITTARTFMRITNLVLDENDEMTLQRDKRSNLGIAIGALGLIPGTIAGIISAFFVGCTRIFFNTGVSAIYYMKKTSNHGLPNTEDGRFAIENDNRTTTAKVLGCLGIPIGWVIGGFGAIFVSSLQTFGRTFAFMFNCPWRAMQISVPRDERSNLGYVIGLLAVPLGLVCGLLGAIIVPAVARLVYESCVFGALSFKYLTNFALHPDDRFIIEHDENLAPSAYALPGFLIGGVLGVTSAIVVTLARFISQTCKSWFYLSGSLLNCAVGWRLCEGLSIDRRSALAKTVGGLGYVFAMATTLPLATFIFAVRKTPLVLSVALGFLCSPLILVFKLGSNAVKHFSKDNQFAQYKQNGELIINDQKSVIQGFKNIYSSLNAWGGFIPNNYVACDADGSRDRWTFFRKCITFNTNSVAERTLNDLLVAYKIFAASRENNFGIEFFSSTEFNDVIKDVKDYYANGCFDTRKEIANLHIEIENIGKFVKSYMEDRRINQQEVPIADVVVPDELPFEILFFGQRQVAPAVPELENADVSPEAEGVPFQLRQQA